MTDLKERAAKVLYNSRLCPVTVYKNDRRVPWSRLTPRQKRRFHLVAQDVLRLAYAEPVTPGMVEAGETAVENNCDECNDSYSAWTIIDEAGAATEAYTAMTAARMKEEGIE